MSQEVLTYPYPFALESGQHLPQLQITYHTYGKLNPEKNNVIWVCHALTANADVLDWFKREAGGRRYQTGINQALRRYMQDQQKPKKRA